MMKKEIVKTMLSMSGKYAVDMIFADWVQCMALAYQNSCCMIRNKLWQEREEQYLSIMKKYSREEQIKLMNMEWMLVLAFEEGISDILGEIYMESGAGNKRTGQFFTPFHLSKLTAEMSFSEEQFDVNGKIVLNEPSVGGRWNGNCVCSSPKRKRNQLPKLFEGSCTGFRLEVCIYGICPI